LEGYYDHKKFLEILRHSK